MISKVNIMENRNKKANRSYISERNEMFFLYIFFFFILFLVGSFFS